VASPGHPRATLGQGRGQARGLRIVQQHQVAGSDLVQQFHGVGVQHVLVVLGLLGREPSSG
jgi:hypothetical protein